MGIDWVRMRPQTTADPQTIARLVELQAESFQRGYPGCWITRGECAPYNEQELRWQQQCLDASRELESLLDFPDFDHETGIAADDAEFDLGRRNYAIARNPIFPQRWRVAANRTFLPDQLAEQPTIWETWIDEVVAGQHQAYLLQQYLHETTTDLNNYAQQLKRTAEASLTATGNWAKKPELIATRQQILSFQPPEIQPAPIFPWPEPDRTEIPTDHPALQATQANIGELVELTRNWDRRVSGSRKLRYYEDYYATFPQYLEAANSADLSEFLGWLKRCSSRGMGVFLQF